MNEDTLKEFFHENKVRAIKVVIMKNDKGQSAGQAIIEFSSQQDADYVIKNLSNSEISGRQVSFRYQSTPSYGGSSGGAGGYGRGRGGYQQQSQY